MVPRRAPRLGENAPTDNSRAARQRNQRGGKKSPATDRGPGVRHFAVDRARRRGRMRAMRIELDAGQLVATTTALRRRIEERFPGSGLRGVAANLCELAERHAARSAAIRAPIWPLRLASCLLLAAGLGAVAWVFLQHRGAARAEAWEWTDTLDVLEKSLSSMFFLTAAGVYVASMETRARRQRCLRALRELRALAHLVDLHQLTKDPDRLLRPGPDTASSPDRPLTPFLLARYLDYCSEMLALVGKLAALYAEFPDPVVLDGIDDVEDLTTGLSRKVWQKIAMLPHTAPGPTAPGAPPTAIA
jgi:hypothetical protein